MSTVAQVHQTESPLFTGAASFTLELLNLMRDATSPQVEAQVLAGFLMIAARGDSNPPNILEIAKLLKVSDASASRIVSILGRGLRGKQGASLLETREDPNNYSRKLVYLSAKGRRLVQLLGETGISHVQRWRRHTSHNSDNDLTEVSPIEGIA